MNAAETVKYNASTELMMAHAAVLVRRFVPDISNKSKIELHSKVLEARKGILDITKDCVEYDAESNDSISSEAPLLKT